MTIHRIHKTLFPALIVLSVFFSCQLSAQKINLQTATGVAQQWVASYAPSGDFKLQFSDSIVQDGQASIYLFDMHPRGFIWISADMAFAPVPAYSFESVASPLDAANPASSFLDTYRSEMADWKNLYPGGTGQHPAWALLPAPEKLKSLPGEASVEPMMQVTWGQGTGYNTYTPENTPTGCVAVAMLQLMRHWEWPPQGHGEHRYTHPDYGEFAVNFDTIAFNWSSLPLNSPSPEIAKIMLYGGIALHMHYAPGGSGAMTERVRELMANTFRYNSSQIRYAGVADFGTMANWILLVKNELINGRPMVYNGSGTGGHAFNFDGFNGDHFHVNWGWSGAYNGYFMLTSLTPGTHNFSDGQGAVLRVFPDTMLMWDRPLSVRAIAGDSKVTMSWTSIYHRERFAHNIYRDGALIGQSSTNLFTDTSAENGTTYHYAVSALYRTDTADYESALSNDFVLTPVEGFSLPFYENFEEDVDGWQLKGTKTGFNWGTAAQLALGTDTIRRFIGINSANAGANVLVSDRLISNAIDLSGVSHAVIRFDYMLRKWQDIDQLHLLYKVFDQDEWIEIAEPERTKGYDDWVEFKAYLPAEALKENVQIAFYYTDNGSVGYGAGIDNIRIEVVNNPGEPDFSVSKNTVCLNTEVVFTDRSAGTRDSYAWDFGDGASPRTATGEGPHTVSYRSPGEKTVKLVLNELDELIREQAITIVAPPVAAFSKTINYKTVTFNNNSYNAVAYMWDFGDGGRVTQKSPSHVYALSGDYLVQLIAINHTCANDTLQQWISIRVTGIDDPDELGEVVIYPNPAGEYINIDWPWPLDEALDLDILAVDGRKLKSQRFEASGQTTSLQVNLAGLSPGSYFIRLTQGDKVRRGRFVKEL